MVASFAAWTCVSNGRILISNSRILISWSGILISYWKMDDFIINQSKPEILVIVPPPLYVLRIAIQMTLLFGIFYWKCRDYGENFPWKMMILYWTMASFVFSIGSEVNNAYGMNQTVIKTLFSPAPDRWVCEQSRRRRRLMVNSE